MKLRIRGNSIRLRLTKSEVEEFRATGEVKELVNFGDSVMTYSLRSAEVDQPRATFVNGELSVAVSKEEANLWTAGDQVGIESASSLADGDELHILIEKDFECLAERPGEDDSDAFPNPLAACGK